MLPHNCLYNFHLFLLHFIDFSHLYEWYALWNFYNSEVHLIFVTQKFFNCRLSKVEFWQQSDCKEVGVLWRWPWKISPQIFKKNTNKIWSESVTRSLVNMRFIDLRRRLCQDKTELSPGGKQRSEGGLFLTSKSESHNSLHLDLDNLQQKLSLSPSPSPETTAGSVRSLGRTRSEVFHKSGEAHSPSSVNIELSCDNDSGESSDIDTSTHSDTLTSQYCPGNPSPASRIKDGWSNS